MLSSTARPHDLLANGSSCGERKEEALFVVEMPTAADSSRRRRAGEGARCVGLMGDYDVRRRAREPQSFYSGCVSDSGND